ncbi:MAG: FecR domain-containing protein [Labilithrix sp.]|nr:FecR domain-containing protein [Labilithrix sp.]
MKPNRSLSDIAARVLSQEARSTSEVAPDVRARAVDAIAAAMRERRRRRHVRWAAFGAAALAASVALVFASQHRQVAPAVATVGPTATAVRPAVSAALVRGAPALVRAGHRQPLSDGAPVVAGDRLLVEAGSRTTIALADGTYLLLRDGADLLLESTAPATTFKLDAGAVHADVAKLKPNERFIVRTPDAEIEVRGTSFEVSQVSPDPACGDGTTTRVSVREGVVAVRARGHETLLRANETWPSGCAFERAGHAPAASVDAGATSLSAAPAGAQEDPHGGAAPGASIKRIEPPASDLRAQNDAFERAVARKRTGDAPGAVAAFDVFLARYPKSHLAQSARAERMKLLRGFDRERARGAARAYLEQHPDGFARSDAELILSADGP